MYEVARLIEMFENMIGQEKLHRETKHLLENAPGYLGDFYQIVSDYNDLCRNQKFQDMVAELENNFKIKKANTQDPELIAEFTGGFKKALAQARAVDKKSREQSLALIQTRIERFFSKNGVTFHWQPHTSGRSDLLPDKILRNMPNYLILLYCKAYIYKNFNIDFKKRTLVLEAGDYAHRRTAQKIAGTILSTIAQEQFRFPAARNLMLELEEDYAIAIHEKVRGAQAGNIRCQAELGQTYLSFLASTLIEENPSEFEMPAGITHAYLVDCLRNARDAGDMQALSYIGSFLINCINAVGAIYQIKEDGSPAISPAQKARLVLMREICEYISGDPQVNAMLRAAWAVPSEGRENREVIHDFKKIKNEAVHLLEENYAKPFLPTVEKINDFLSKSDAKKFPDYDQSFSKLQIILLIEQMNIMEKTLNKEKSRLKFLLQSEVLVFGEESRQKRINAIETCLEQFSAVRITAEQQQWADSLDPEKLMDDICSAIHELEIAVDPSKAENSRSSALQCVSNFLQAKTVTGTKIFPMLDRVKNRLNAPLYLDPRDSVSTQAKNLSARLATAAFNGDVGLVKAAVAQGFDINSQAPHEDGLLARAIKGEELAMVSFLLSLRTVNLFAIGSHNNTPYILAKKSQNLEIKALVEHCAQAQAAQEPLVFDFHRARRQAASEENYSSAVPQVPQGGKVIEYKKR